MQFVILFGQGRFLSRHVHQIILDIIDRAMAAFSATGMNPDRYFIITSWLKGYCLLVNHQKIVKNSLLHYCRVKVNQAHACKPILQAYSYNTFKMKLIYSWNVCSVLPSDDWFIDVAHDAISRISGKPRVPNGEREVNSPTASVSAQSVSSVRSHGSS
jgi:hypothetical protein